MQTFTKNRSASRSPREPNEQIMSHSEYDENKQRVSEAASADRFYEPKLSSYPNVSIEEPDENEEFYTPGSENLYHCRMKIAKWSLKQTSRMHKGFRLFVKNNSLNEILMEKRRVNALYSTFCLHNSQSLTGRCISIVRVSPDDQAVAAGSWDGNTYILNSQDLSLRRVLYGNNSKIGGIDWYYDSRIIATSQSDGTINLFQYSTDAGTKNTETNNSRDSKLQGHNDRVARLSFHPMGRYLASASFDSTWRYWDVETQQQLLLQEGHTKPVFTVEHQPNGSLISSAGLDGIVKIWDLRLGKCISNLEGHMGSIYGSSWRYNGYELATASSDGCIKIWDMRMQKEKVSIPAHSKLISDVRLLDDVMISSSYDNTINIFSNDNWVKIKTIKGHTDKVMSCDITKSGQSIFSSGWDRTIKLYKSAKEY
ncbi:hypothetical protein LJB42_001256 [Komagataella kurtzmanii]|nr:hypothetical protein LJB42_001256 [Komagataella kurtzmanii]